MAPRTSAPPVLGVLGSSGGLGASTLASALAVSAAPARPPVVCVDGQLHGGGLDVTACAEHRAGIRWADLAGARGDVPGADLLAELPESGGVRLLSAGPGGATPPPAVIVSVLGSLREVAGLLVVDLPSGADHGEPFLSACDAVVLLSGVSARHLADAVAASGRVSVAGPEAWLVVRGSARGVAWGADLPEAMAAHLDLPLAGCWRDDPKLALDAERGRAPGERARSSLATLCGRLLEQVVPHGRAA